MSCRLAALRQRVVDRPALPVPSWTLAALLVGLLACRLLGVEQGAFGAAAMGLLPLLLLPAYPLLVRSALLRRTRLAAVALAVVAAHLLLVAPALDRSERACTGTPLRVVTANVLRTNPDPARVGRALRLLRPDVLVVPELTPRGLDGLLAAGLGEDLPYRLVGQEGDPETVGLLSRFPLADPVLVPASGRLWPRATVDVGGTAVRLLAVHPLPPLSRYGDAWRPALQGLSRELQDLALPAVVAGDFNSGRDHATFRRLLRDGVRDASEERGRGLAPTWPQRRPVLHLDHVLVRDGAGGTVAVCDLGERALPGSDHLAVLADLSVGSDPERR